MAELTETEFTLFFAGDTEQLHDLIHQHADANVALIYSDTSTDQTKELLNLVKNSLPNCARGLVTSELNSDYLKEDLVNQIISHDSTANDILLRLLELVQVNRLKWQVSEIEKIAITDPVTGMSNSRYFQSSLEVTIDKKSPFGLILIDIDQFRNFNEAFGYGEGDKILAAIGERIRALLPDNVNIFRIGSDEFAVIHSSMTPADAHSIGETIRRGFERFPFQGPNRRPAYVTVSLGMTTFPDHGIQYSDIITSAKSALHQAKRRGRNQTVVAQIC